jgi:hypothetical protein
MAHNILHITQKNSRSLKNLKKSLECFLTQ